MTRFAAEKTYPDMKISKISIAILSKVTTPWFDVSHFLSALLLNAFSPTSHKFPDPIRIQFFGWKLTPFLHR